MPSSSVIMSSLFGSHLAVLAAAVAVSGSFILFATRETRFALAQLSATRSCMTILDGHGKKASKSKKRVTFADNLVESVDIPARVDNESREKEIISDEDQDSRRAAYSEFRRLERMPANRVALYRGVLQDRLNRSTIYNS